MSTNDCARPNSGTPANGDGESLRAEPATIDPGALLWSLDDLARAMGVDRRTVERLEAAGAIGPTRLKIGGRLVRFLTDECRSWIAARCPPRDEWQQRNGANGPEVRRPVRKGLGK